MVRVTFQRYGDGWHVESVEYKTIWDSYRFRAPEGHGGIPRLNEIGDCPKEFAFDHSQELGRGDRIYSELEGSPNG